jgi:hypothetical protein
VLLMAAVPVICAFIGTTQIGWNFGDGTVVKLNWFTGLYLAILFYGVMLAGWRSWGGSFTGWRVTIRSAHRWRTVWSLPDMSRPAVLKRYCCALSTGLAVRADRYHCSLLHRLSAVSGGSNLPEYQQRRG